MNPHTANRPLLIFGVVLLLLLPPCFCYGHKLRIFAWPEGERIVGETAFSGNRKPVNAEISVLNRQDNSVLFVTKTDAEGRFSFVVPGKAIRERIDLLLVVNSGEGHRAEWPLPAAEYLAASSPDKILDASTDRASSSVTDHRQPPSSDPATGCRIDEEMIRRIVAEELEKKLAPVRRDLVKAGYNGTDIRDVLGGLGYIIGLAGLFAWLKTRNNEEQ